MKGQKWDNVFLSILFQCHSTARTDTIPAHSLLSVYTVVSSLSLFLNLTLSYLCLLTIIWVCDVLFFWKICFCRFVLSTFLIFNFFSCYLLSVVSSSTSLHQKHIYSQHDCKIHTFPLFMKSQICIFWMSHVGSQTVRNDWRDLARVCYRSVIFLYFQMILPNLICKYFYLMSQRHKIVYKIKYTLRNIIDSKMFFKFTWSRIIISKWKLI